MACEINDSLEKGLAHLCLRPLAAATIALTKCDLGLFSADFGVRPTDDLEGDRARG